MHAPGATKFSLVVRRQDLCNVASMGTDPAGSALENPHASVCVSGRTVAMDSSNIKPLAGFSVLRRFGATLSLFVTLALAACQPGPAQEGDDFLPDPVDGIGTSPSDPDPTPDPDPPPPTSGKRVAGPNDPSGCPSGMVVITGTTGNDVLEGSSADECFVGLEGDDSIFTGG